MRNGRRRKKRNAPPPVLGMLDPERVYTKEGLLRHAGLGNQSVRQMVHSGVVQPRFVGRRVYFLGCEVIDWIVQTAESHPPSMPDYDPLTPRKGEDDD